MNQELVIILNTNGLAIVATDTLYGVLGNAHSQEVVERIYDLKGRDEHKPFIILIPSIDSLKDFHITLSEKAMLTMSNLWPGAVTIILPVAEEYQSALQYLHRGTNELAFRLPAKEKLLALLQQTGPLVAPSANPQGATPAYTIDEAKEYFGDNVDYYEDEGRVEGLPSTIIRIQDDEITVIRQGAVTVS